MVALCAFTQISLPTAVEILFLVGDFELGCVSDLLNNFACLLVRHSRSSAAPTSNTIPEKYLSEAAQLCNDNPIIFRNFSVLFAQQGRMDDACRMFSQYKSKQKLLRSISMRKSMYE